MKTLIIALALVLGLTGFAQETTPPQKRANSERMTPEQRQQKHLEHLTKELNLDAKQQEAVGKLLAEKSTKAQNVKNQAHTRKTSGAKLTPEEREALKTKMEAEKTDTEAKMKGILTADQYQKWLTLREDNREKIGSKMGEKRGGMGGAPMEKRTPEEYQQKHLANLTKELNLDAKQQEAVSKLLAEKSAKAQDLKTQGQNRKASGKELTPEEREAIKTKMQAEKADTEAKMKGILTADQYQKWLTLREDNRAKMGAKMGEKRGGMGGAPMEKRTPEDFQQKHLANLTKELNLDTKQQEAVSKLLAEKSAKAQDLKTQGQTRKASGNRLTPEEREALKAKMQAEKTDTEAKMKTILSDEQYKKWLTIREENKENIKNNMRNNGRRGGSRE